MATRTATRMNFGVWLAQVDQACWALAGCSYQDLSDNCYGDWYEDGLSPRAAARRAIRNDGGDEE